MSGPVRTVGVGERGELVLLYRRLLTRGLVAIRPELPESIAGLADRPLPRSPRAILFDLYGTLVLSGARGIHDLPHENTVQARSRRGGSRSSDSRKTPIPLPRKGRGGDPLSTSSIAAALRAAGLPGNPDYLSSLFARLPDAIRGARALLEQVGNNPEVDVRDAIRTLESGLAIAEIERLVILYESLNNPCAAMEGVPEMLSDPALARVEMGIVSNAQFYTPILFEAIYGQSPDEAGFDPGLVFYSWRYGIAKPDPRFFPLAVRALGDRGIDPRDVLVIGNSVASDIEPARDSGFMTALYAGDGHSFRPAGTRQDPHESLPDTVVVDWRSFAKKIVPS